MSEPAGGVPPPTSGDGEGRTDAAWKAVAGNLLDARKLLQLTDPPPTGSSSGSLDATGNSGSADDASFLARISFM